MIMHTAYSEQLSNWDILNEDTPVCLHLGRFKLRGGCGAAGHLWQAKQNKTLKLNIGVMFTAMHACMHACIHVCIYVRTYMCT